MNQSVLIIGGGIAGITSAYEATKRGYKVTLVDRNKLAEECSFANGGQISVCNSEVWNRWINVKKSLKWLLKPDAPLYINPKISRPKISWLSQFMWHTIKGSYQENTTRTIKIALKSRNKILEVAEKEKIDFEKSAQGMLHIYRNKSSLKAAEKAVNIFKSTGWQRRMVTKEEIAEIEPALNTKNSIGDIIGGTFIQDDFGGDIYLFVTSMARILENKYQTEIITNFNVTDFTRKQGKWLVNAKLLDSNGAAISNVTREFDKVVVAAGAYSSQLLKKFYSINIYPVKGYSITIGFNKKTSAFMPKISLLDDDAKIVTSTFRNRLRVAGTAEFNGWNHDINPVRTKPLKDWVKITFPKAPMNEITEWACLRPMTPNMMPIAKKVGDNLYLNSGAGHLGWTVSMQLANMLAIELEK